MGRISKAYEARFRALLLRLHARRLEAGVGQLVGHARSRAAREGLPVTDALSDACERLRRQVKAWQRRAHPAPPPPRDTEPRFVCDAGLGGLARWLRAAGYEAFWFPGIGDAELLRQARQLDAILLTTDSLLMERGVLRDGIIPSFWLPPVPTKVEQLALVRREFDLKLRPPRCMSCGGELRPVDKQAVFERIPPRTRRWLDEYFLCLRCGRLFWRGTHWQNIREKLGQFPPGTRTGQISP